jgi:riboflavin transporter FmnP
MATEQGMNPHSASVPAGVALPAPTAWPFVLAFGLALLFTGLLTAGTVSALGAVLSVAGAVGWFREVLPHEQHETVPLAIEAVPIVTERREVVRIDIVPEMHRARIPVEIYPISAGVKGGLAGSVAMTVLAALYGVLSHGSIWYPINLLASVVYAEPLQLSMQHLTSFQPVLLLVATALHLVTSLLVGLLYGVMLPMFPRRPILLGGFIAPLMWSGLLYTTLGIINPLLNQRIDWSWFVASQIGFGIVAGLVVVRQERVRTHQDLPFAVLAGIEAPGIIDEKKDGSEKR